jgi:hypothetical protein
MLSASLLISISQAGMLYTYEPPICGIPKQVRDDVNYFFNRF